MMNAFSLELIEYMMIPSMNQSWKCQFVWKRNKHKFIWTTIYFQHLLNIMKSFDATTYYRVQHWNLCVATKEQQSAMLNCWFEMQTLESYSPRDA